MHHRHGSAPSPPSSDHPQRPVSHQSDEVVFSTCLDNTRRCFLLLKYVYAPLLLVCGSLNIILHILAYFGYIQKLSFIFVFVYCIIASVTAAPVVLIPAIFRASRIPVRVRLAASNCIFTSLCLIVPVFTAHCIWRRQYRELNGFLLVHEFFPAAPARMRPAVVSKHEPLSICDDEFFFVLFVLDYAYTSVAPFFMPMIIELPPKYFAFYFSVYALLFWISACRVANVYVDSCANHPESGAWAELVKKFLPLCHMLHVVIYVKYMFSRLFLSSRNREHNKNWVASALNNAFLTSIIHLEAVLNRAKPSHAPPSRSFWSRTDLLIMSETPSPMLLPAHVGISIRVTSGLKDLGLYVWALGLPVFYSVFEIMRHVINVDSSVCTIMYTFLWKFLPFIAGLILPHYFVAKLIYQNRVPSSWFVYCCCLVAIVFCVSFIKPGTAGILPLNFRFFVFFLMSIVVPPTVVRAFSHFASSKFIVLVFSALHMYGPLVQLFATMFHA